MVKKEKPSDKMQSTYYLKPGQTLQNTKVADRKLALILSKSTFDRFVDYATENEKLAAKEEAAKIAAGEKMISPVDISADIRKRRKEEYLNKKKKEEEARAQFVKDTIAKKAAEREKVVAEAKKLLFWQKPQCRLINGALLTSECYRQLDAQLAFEQSLKDVDKERDLQYAKSIMEDVENAVKEEKKKAEELLKRNRDYGAQLKKQIEGVGNELERRNLLELESQKKDLKHMVQEIRMIEECEAEQIRKRKNELKKLFTDALEEKKHQEMELKRNELFEDRVIEVYRKSKERIRQIGKLKLKEAREEKLRHAEALAKKGAVRYSRDAEEQEIIRKAAEEKEALEREQQKSKKEKEELIRADIEKYKKELKMISEYRANEEKDLRTWETLQRFKRDEYNKDVLAEKMKQESRMKKEMAHFLRKQMAERETENQRQKLMDDDSAQTKASIERTNEKVLAYGEEVLEECKALNEANPGGPARPLFPILKVMEEFKKENRLIPPKIYEAPETPKRRERRQRPVCPKSSELFCYVEPDSI